MLGVTSWCSLMYRVQGLLGFILPFLASWRTLSVYKGKVGDVPPSVLMQRLLFLLLLQSLPLALILSIQLFYLSIYFSICIIIILGIRGYASMLPRLNNMLTIYHPHADQRAGGEMVLWSFIAALKDIQVTVCTNTLNTTYPNETAMSTEILDNAKSTFNTIFDITPTFFYLHHTDLSDPMHYPRLTLILQSWNSMLPMQEVVTYYLFQLKATPTYVIDTAGYPFTSIICWLVGIPFGTYTHYPVISTDMLDLVQHQKATYNNTISKSKLLSYIKAVYYLLFACMFYLAGQCHSVVMVNGTWTYNHMKQLWRKQVIYKVYPPCRIDDVLQKTNLSIQEIQKIWSLQVVPREQQFLTEYLAASTSETRYPMFMSQSQFRPEKNHPMQVEAFAECLKQTGTHCPKTKLPYKLILIGTARACDQGRILALRSQIRDLHLEDHISIVLDLHRKLLECVCLLSFGGIHAMRDEHFGIGVVEMLAYGVQTIAHKSGGPLLDIITPSLDVDRNNGLGYLADSRTEYTDKMQQVLHLYQTMSLVEKQAQLQKCQTHSLKFNVAEFNKKIHSIIPQIMKK